VTPSYRWRSPSVVGGGPSSGASAVSGNSSRNTSRLWPPPVRPTIVNTTNSKTPAYRPASASRHRCAKCAGSFLNAPSPPLAKLRTRGFLPASVRRRAASRVDSFVTSTTVAELLGSGTASGSSGGMLI
jgi:hypothetical protein